MTPMSTTVSAVTDSDFDREVLASDRVVLVDFWAEWCAPCRMIAPVVEALAAELGGRLKVLKMVIDANPRVRDALGVLSIPTLISFKDGQPADRTVGYRSGLKTDLREKLEALL